MSKLFEFNTKGEPCPLCNKKTMKEAMLVPIMGTANGKNVEAIQVHLDCIIEKAQYYENASMILIPCHDYDPS